MVTYVCSLLFDVIRRVLCVVVVVSCSLVAVCRGLLNVW